MNARCFALACCALGACYQTPDFASASLVTGPRVLAITAEPPEIAPGASSRLSVLAVNAPDALIEFRACATFTAWVSGAQYGQDTADKGCGDDASSYVLGRASSVDLPGELTSGLFDNLALARSLLGAQLPAASIDAIRNNVGLAYLIEVRVATGGKELRAVKRVLISDDPHPNQNPPAPHFTFGDTEVIPATAQPMAADPLALDAFRCQTPDGAPVQVAPGASVPLEPIVPDGGEPWLETYTVIDARGQLSERREQAFYAWYATAGSLEHRETQAPGRDNLWHAPEQPGCGRLWNVVRDGHGGLSACGVDFRVGDASCDGGS